MSSTEVTLQNILDAYYSDNAKKLHKAVDRILFKFGGWSNKDIDDFYSLANEVFANILEKYDYEQSFDGFLHFCLHNKIKSEITRRNREKRKADRMSVSFDVIDNEEDECNLLNLIPSDFDTFEEALKHQGKGQYHDKVQSYISKLSNRQVNILNLLMCGYKEQEIRQMLEMPKNEYDDNLQIMRSYENVKVLF